MELSLPFLRRLMGNAWVDTNVLGGNPKHLLGLWRTSGRSNPWINYTEELVKAILTGERFELDPITLKQKLESEYISTLTEMETAVFLQQRGFAVVMEPNAPHTGPDLGNNYLDSTTYFLYSYVYGGDRYEQRP